MYIDFLRLRIYPAAIAATSMFGSVFSPVYAFEKPHEQEFVITAYYSPLPDQCCYFRGNYADEITFNGGGIVGADGTGVYPGMIAAPPTYQFGTMIELPGFGIGTVHDRGSRITEWGDDLHRIDIWMGRGEEGLARALAWGVRRVKGTVYPISSSMPAENFSLKSVPADSSALSSLPKPDPAALLMTAEAGDIGPSARALQTTLKELGYFTDAVTGTYGDKTAAALKKFMSDTGLPGDGTKVDTLTASALLASADIGPENLPDLAVGLTRGSAAADVRQAQKLLRYLGFYQGRTDGVFDVDLKAAVLSFQKKSDIIASDDQAGAGRIGPATKKEILKQWKAKIVLAKAKSLAAKHEVASAVKDEKIPGKTLASGDHGKNVKLLQSFLVDVGYLPASDVTGTFGARTEAALRKFQVDRKIIVSSAAHGAGVFGPATRNVVTQELIDAEWREVREKGM